MKEYVNKVQLAGRVGSVKISEINDQFVLKLSVATEETLFLRDGANMVNVTWHRVRYWTKDKKLVESIRNGDWVNVAGKIHATRYTGKNNLEESVSEILAHSLTREV